MWVHVLRSYVFLFVLLVKQVCLTNNIFNHMHMYAHICFNIISMLAGYKHKSTVCHVCRLSNPYLCWINPKTTPMLIDHGSGVVCQPPDSCCCFVETLQPPRVPFWHPWDSLQHPRAIIIALSLPMIAYRGTPYDKSSHIANWTDPPACSMGILPEFRLGHVQ